jgi:hypothetical protein
MGDGKGADLPQNRPLATLTHARLRVAQGDLRGARAILREILEREGEAPGAEELLQQLRGRRDRDRAPEGERSLPDAEPGDPEKLGEDFRRLFSASGSGRQAAIERLEEWLSRISGGEGEPD